MSFESFPHLIGWELTLACNLRCSHCASSAGTPRPHELSLEESLLLCDQFSELLAYEVVFTGGEPFLNPGWSEIATKLRDLGIKTGIVTNGLSVTDEVISRMRECGLKSAGVSIDGPQIVHDRIRCLSGSYDKSIRGAQRLVDGDIGLTVITSVCALNIAHLDEMLEIVRSLGAWQWQLQPLFPSGRGNSNRELHLSGEDFLRLGRFICDHSDSSVFPRVLGADSCGYFSEFDVQKFGWSGCSAGRSSLGIMSDGRVKGCLSWPDWTVEGDLRKDDLWTIWFRPSAFARLRNVTATDLGTLCRNCDHASDCAGGCEAMSLAATGTWHNDSYCFHRLQQRVSDLSRTLIQLEPIH